MAASAELLRVPAVEAVELMLQSGMELACGHLDRPLPMPDPHGAYLLVEAAGDEPQEGALAEAVAGLAGVEDALLADDAAGRASLWALREGHSVAVASTGIPPHKLDVTLPPGLLAEFIPRSDRAVEALDPSFRVITYGHVGDGNMHVNVIGPAPDDERVDETVLGLVAEMGGSISAEHGIGVAKAPYLHLGRSAGGHRGDARGQARARPRRPAQPGRDLRSRRRVPGVRNLWHMCQRILTPWHTATAAARTRSRSCRRRGRAAPSGPARCGTSRCRR